MALLSEAENERRRKLYNKGLNDHEMANEVDVTPQSIRHWRDNFDLSPNGLRPGESLEPPEKKEMKKEILKNEYSSLQEVAGSFGVCIATLSNWLEQMNFPKTPKGTFSLPWIRISCNKKGIIETSKKYSATEAARQFNTCPTNIQNFLQFQNVDWNENGQSLKPERGKRIEPFLSIEGEYFKLKNCGCDYIIVKDKDRCILIEEKDSLQYNLLSEAVRELMIAEKIVKDYFGLTSQRKIIYCESPDFDSIQISKIRRTEKYLDIEIWHWNSQN